MVKLYYEVDKEVDKKNICELFETVIFTMLYLPYRSPGAARALAALPSRTPTLDLFPNTPGQCRVRVPTTIGGWAG